MTTEGGGGGGGILSITVLCTKNLEVVDWNHDIAKVGIASNFGAVSELSGIWSSYSSAKHNI